MNFAERLKELRKSRELSQGDVAKVLGVTRAAVSQYEMGVRKPSYEMMEVLADYFNVDMDYLLGRTDKTTTKLSRQTDRRQSIILMTKQENCFSSWMKTLSIK